MDELHMASDEFFLVSTTKSCLNLDTIHLFHLRGPHYAYCLWMYMYLCVVCYRGYDTCAIRALFFNVITDLVV